MSSSCTLSGRENNLRHETDAWYSCDFLSNRYWRCILFTYFFFSQGGVDDLLVLWQPGGSAGLFWSGERLLKGQRWLQPQLPLHIWPKAGLQRLCGALSSPSLYILSLCILINHNFEKVLKHSSFKLLSILILFNSNTWAISQLFWIRNFSSAFDYRTQITGLLAFFAIISQFILLKAHQPWNEAWSLVSLAICLMLNMTSVSFFSRV